MKRAIFTLLVLVVLPTSSIAETFLGAPVIPEGTVTKETDDRLELKTTLSHEQVLAFYREALKGVDNIKFRDWKNDTYIEDDGNMQWHSITISKKDTDGTHVVIVKDSWTWIIGTLVLRYIGVFMVLMVLFLAMTLSGKIISTLVGKLEAKKAT